MNEGNQPLFNISEKKPFEFEANGVKYIATPNDFAVKEAGRSRRRYVLARTHGGILPEAHAAVSGLARQEQAADVSNGILRILGRTLP